MSFPGGIMNYNMKNTKDIFCMKLTVSHVKTRDQNYVQKVSEYDPASISVSDWLAKNFPNQ